MPIHRPGPPRLMVSWERVEYEDERGEVWRAQIAVDDFDRPRARDVKVGDGYVVMEFTVEHPDPRGAT